MACSKIDGSMCKERGFKVTSGAVEEDYSFEWKIENFVVIKSSKDFIDQQKFHFEVGASHGNTTKWRAYLLQEKTDAERIGIILQLTKAPPKFKTIVNFTFQTIRPNGGICKIGTGTSQEFTVESLGWGFPEMIPVNDDDIKELIWEDGSIAIKFDLQFFIVKPVAVVQPKRNNVCLEEELNCFEIRELRSLSLSMIKLGGQQDVGKIIKVVSKDQMEFYVNTATLSARSPVFQAMFRSGNWKEGRGSSGRKGGGGGSLVLEDMSGKTVKVLLHFLMGGVLVKEEWRDGDVILELTYAADKYQLDGLVEFLDKVLPAINYGTEILARLALLTKRLGMKNAEKGLFEKLKISATDIDQLVLDKGGSLLGKD